MCSEDIGACPALLVAVDSGGSLAQRAHCTDVARDHIHLIAARHALSSALPRALADARLPRRGGDALQGVLAPPLPPLLLSRASIAWHFGRVPILVLTVT